MSIDRVSTNSQMQYMLAQINTANQNLQTAQNQVASGKVATDYAGLGDKTAVLESARAAAARATAYQSNTQLAVNQADLQDTQLSALGSLADQLHQALATSLGNGDGSTLMTQAQSIFDSASQILNSKDANGNYLFGGGKDNTPPFTATSLSDLASMSSVSSAFANGTIKKSVNVGDGESVQVGVLASDVGTDLMNMLKSLATFNAGSTGNFSSSLSDAQQTYLTSSLGTAQAAASTINNATAANGYVYNRLNDAVTHQGSMSTLYQGFVSNLEDVDMGTAVTNLNQDQVALQAALKVTSQLNSVSLLNYLPAPSG